jgi:hypothetical protein
MEVYPKRKKEKSNEYGFILVLPHTNFQYIVPTGSVIAAVSADYGFSNYAAARLY